MKRTRSSCFQQIDPNHYKSLGEVTTEPRSRAGLYVLERHRLYVALPRYEEKEAHIPGLPSRLNSTKTFE
jgi:hypothetical protein